MGFNDTRCVMEPAGALSIAGANKYLRQHNLVGLTVAAVTSGANMDFDRLRFVSERADSSETLLSVAIPERPGESAYRAVSCICVARVLCCTVSDGCQLSGTAAVAAVIVATGYCYGYCCIC
eukprot:18898-Heterococcus_DN1.PRE.3